MAERQHFALGEILQGEESKAVIRIFQDAVTRIAAEVVTPALPRIDGWTGRQNDARYLAYMIVVAIASAAGELADGERA